MGAVWSVRLDEARTESDQAGSISKNKAIETTTFLVGVLEKNTTVYLHLANSILYPIPVLAIYGLSCRWIGTNTAYTDPELEHHIRVSDTMYVVTREEHLGTVHPAAGSAKLFSSPIYCPKRVLEVVLHVRSFELFTICRESQA